MVFLLALTVGALVFVLAMPEPDPQPAHHWGDPWAPPTSAARELRWTERVLRALNIHPSPDSALGRDLLLANSPLTLSDLLVYKGLAVLVGLTVAQLFFLAGDRFLAAFSGLVAVLAWGLPDARIRGEARRSRAQIAQRLPAFLQALAMMLEAGLNLQPALKAYVAQDDTAFGRELRAAVAEMERGRPMADALLAFASRCQVEELYRAVAALVQAYERGAAGLADTCRDLAAQAWAWRRDRAREVGKQASTKMLAPMMLLILPVLLLFVLGPALISMSGGF